MPKEKPQNSLSLDELIQKLDNESTNSDEEDSFEQIPDSVREAFLPESNKFVKTIKNLPPDEFDQYSSEVEELCRRFYGRKSKLSREEKTKLISEFTAINRKYGIVIPPILLLIFSIGNFVINLLRFILLLRKKKQEQKSIESLLDDMDEPSYEEEDKPHIVYEGWISDKFKEMFKTKILPIVINGTAEFLEQKKDLIIDILVAAVKDGLNSSLDKLVVKLRSNQQELLDLD
jgi:hypothetical protein